MTKALPCLELMGTPLQLTDYDELAQACQQWTRAGKCVALDFANTQIVTMRRHEAGFREITSKYDGFVPDGMPLVWCLNRAGARLKDRVYGPTFMRRFLETVPGGFTHYLLGGSAECGARLETAFKRMNPAIQFVGGFHGRCLPDGSLEPADEQNVIDEIKRLSPDFIWVGFGTPKQQAWVRRYKDRVRRGVILTVGFAFDVNAGMKPDAPPWMQRLGLTWVFRFCSEPRRLAGRYFKYNLLFLGYLIFDGLRGGAFRKAKPAREQD